MERFRISSIEPNLLTEEIIRWVSGSEKLMPHFHIPLQSGSDEVLKLMKRKYDTALFRSRVDTIRTLIPDAFIGVDVITGVRGETDRLFEETRQFLNELDVSQLHVFTYSERPNTGALKIEYTVPQEERKRRSALLHEISAHKTKKFYQQYEQSRARVLFEGHPSEGLMHGFTENYLRVETPFNEQLANRIVEVKLKTLSPRTGNMTIELPSGFVEKEKLKFSPENLQL